jgi:putative transferase (TIGR04331 family)
MSSKQVLFVADTAFIDSKIIKQYQLLSVFPRERGDRAYRASLDELLQRSKLQSTYYDELLPKLVPVFKTYMHAAGNEAGHLIRPALVTVTSLFVDLLIRVLHRIRQQQSVNIAVVEVEPIIGFQWLSEITQTWHINQEIIQRIMVALGYKKIAALNQENYPEYPSSHTQKNLIFRPQQPGLYGFLSRLLNPFFGLLEKIPNNSAKFQSLGFTMDRYYLAKHRLLGPFSSLQKRLNIQLVPSSKDLNLRENLFMEIEEIIKPQFELFFSQIEQHFYSDELRQLSLAYVQIVIDWFPIGFLEGLSSNIKKIRQNSNIEHTVGIIGHSLTSDLGYLASTVARLAGKTVIGVQHGGHYGYIDDFSQAGQSEYAHYEKFITWGWTNIDEHLPQCKTIPLPSPKLSEQPFKSNYLDGIKSQQTKTHDVLFLSNQFHRFPHISTCGASRVDFIDDITSSQESLMRALKKVGLTISHKPYNMKFLDLYPAHYHQLEIAGGTGYHLLRSTHKGLTVKLIKTCRILVWDQIGSGTLEAFTSEVPTIVYWKRIYSREAPWARNLVAGLEQQGVVHSDPETLAQEIKIYLADPLAWMNNDSRKKAIKAFCEKFALTDPLWYDKWKSFLSKSNIH